MNHFDHTSSAASSTVDPSTGSNHQVQVIVGNELSDTSTTGQQHTSTSNDQQLHLMINIPNGATFHQQHQQNYHHNPNNSEHAPSYAYYTYDSTGQLTHATALTAATATPFQVSWNKVEFSAPGSQTNGPLTVVQAQQNEWYHPQQQQPQQQQGHQLLAAVGSASTQPTTILVASSGSGTIKIPSDVYGQQPQKVTTTFNQQFATPSDSLQSLHQSTGTPLQITIVPSSSVQQQQPQQAITTASGTSTTKTPATKITSKRNQNRSSNSQNGNKDGRQAKPVSAYALFFRDTQASIKAENPSASFGEISKIVASKWEVLRKEDKDIYKERADLEKRSYLQNLASNKAKEIASTISNEVLVSSDNDHQHSQSQTTGTGVVMVPSAMQVSSSTIPTTTTPTASHQQQTGTEVSFDESPTTTSSGMTTAMLEDSLISDTVTVPVDSISLSSYNTFNYQPHHQIHSADDTYHSALNNPVMSQASSAYPESAQPSHHHQFGSSNDSNNNDKAHQSHSHSQHHQSPSTFSFNNDDESSFFDAAPNENNLIDLGIDLNDFDDIHLLNEHIYSPNSNSVFDVDAPCLDSNPVDYLNQLPEASDGSQSTATSNLESSTHLAYNTTTEQTLIPQQPNISGSSYSSQQTSEMIYQQQSHQELEQNITNDDQHYENNNNYLLNSSTSMEPSVDSSSSSAITTSSSLVNGNEMNDRKLSTICARSGCQRPPIDSSQWDTEFCSEECCVRYCADVFRTWTSNKATTSTISTKPEIGPDVSESTMSTAAPLASSS